MFANEREIINWIKKPVPYENLTKNSTAFKCKEKYSTCANNKTCLFPMTGIEVNMCVEKCPPSYPTLFLEVCGDGVC